MNDTTVPDASCSKASADPVRHHKWVQTTEQQDNSPDALLSMLGSGRPLHQAPATGVSGSIYGITRVERTSREGESVGLWCVSAKRQSLEIERNFYDQRLGGADAALT
ncbi:MAG: hypothetical protein LBH31_02450 [Burkholderiaceae bacterium]|jgi:hypothetical protein|nr:hypothetical protein [Burkholderiaceae bacterium]